MNKNRILTEIKIMNKKAYIKNVIRTTLAEAYVKQASLLGKNKDSYSLGEGITDATLLGAGAGTGGFTAKELLKQRMAKRSIKLSDRTTSRIQHAMEAVRNSNVEIKPNSTFISELLPAAYHRHDARQAAAGLNTFGLKPKDVTSRGIARKVYREGAKTVKMPTRLAKLFRGARNRGALIGGGVVGAGVLANRIFNRD